MSNEQETAARNFSYYWNGRGDEKSDTQDFWRDLLHDIFGVERTTGFIKFEQRIPDTQLWIDGIIPYTKVLIEQKSFGKNLLERYHQADGELLTPLDQAKRYAEAMPLSTRPRWIVTCNFDEFRIYDLAEMNLLAYLLHAKEYEPKVIKLAELNHAYSGLKFLVDPNAKETPEVKISTDAAKIIKKICLAVDPQYAKGDDDYIDTLSKLCARLVFCFYADDEKLFTKIKFEDWFQKVPTGNLREALQKLFDTLNTPTDERPKNLDDDLKKFPYVNGGLFDERLNIPSLNQNFKTAVARAHNEEHVRNINLDELGKILRFSWREISPPIFGAMFESVFNEATRRTGGIHYTSVENIHKVIDPLFFDDLSNELADIKRMRKKNRVAALQNFQDKLAALNFLDPACGSGNFLTETYLSLRRLENEALAELRALNAELPDDPIKVTPRQFFGIELNDFAVAVAKDALWISEIQMRRKTSWIIGHELPDLPLRKNISVVCENALRVDWQEVFGDAAPETFDYIIGNPPFVGARNKSDEQARDIQKVFHGRGKLGNLDYVTCWYKKASEFIRNTDTRCAFISTNSVCQGDSVGALWKNLFDAGVHIDFAHRTFKWKSDSINMAQVYCVIVGFSVATNDKPKIIFDGDKKIVAQNINAYLVDGENIFVESRNEPLQDNVPSIGIGNKPIDNGNYLFKPDEKKIFLRDEPAAAKFFRPWYGAEEFINGKERWCLWLGNASPDEIEKLPHCLERVENVRRYRLASKSPGTRAIADKPTRFHVENFPEGNFILVPKTSSVLRRYIPMGFMPPNVIGSDLVFIIPAAQIYHFGILTSSIHMAWTRATCGRLGIGYRYSKGIVYNNFPWPSPSPAQKRLIEESAQKILDVRKKFPSRSFASLYDEETMPDELRSAHVMNDTAVALAYGFQNFLNDEARIVAELMKLYAALTK